MGEVFKENKNRHSWENSAMTILDASRCNSKTLWTLIDWALLRLSFHTDELVLGQYVCSLRVDLGKLISPSLVHEHSAISANIVTQFLAGLFGLMPSGKVASQNKGTKKIYSLVLSSFSCGITLSTIHMPCCTHDHKLLLLDKLCKSGMT